MKKTIITGLLFLSYIASYSQCSIIYDFKTGEFTDDCESKLNKGSINKIYVKNYNPFIYTLSSETKIKDNTSKLPKFIVGLFGMGQTNPFLKSKLPNTDTVSSENKDKAIKIRLDKIKTFLEKYFKAINIYSEIRKPTLNCKMVKGLVYKNFNDEDLLSYYKTAFNAYNDGVSNRAINKYEIYFKSEVLDKIIELNLFLIHLKEYLYDTEDCKVLIKKFKTKGESVTITLKFTPRDEIKSFSTPYRIVKASKTLKTKRSFNVHFSSGIMLTRNLKKDFFIRKIDSVQFRIKEEDRGKYLTGITALAHIKPVQNSLSLLIGGGINIEGTVHLLTGVSYPIDKINLNFGYGWVLTDELSDGLSKELIFTEAPALKTKKILDGNIWFGLSYNF